MVFAAGLSASLAQVTAAFTRVGSVPVEVRMDLDSGPTGRGTDQIDPTRVRAVIEAQPGTAHVAAAWRSTVQVAGIDRPVQLTSYDTDDPWTGYELISGRWFAAADEVMAGSHLLRVTGHAVGDTLTLPNEHGQRTVRVVGEIFDNANGGFGLVGPSSLVGGPSATVRPDLFEIGLTPG